jgi:hypothetical protein
VGDLAQPRWPGKTSQVVLPPAGVSASVVLSDRPAASSLRQEFGLTPAARMLVGMHWGRPRHTNEAVKASDVMTTMGCGDTCALYPGKRYEDWALEDPAGKGVDAVRPIRDETRRRVGSR